MSINEIKAKLNINNEKNKKISFKDSLQKYGRLRSTFREGENDGWKKYFNDKIINFFEKNIPDSIDKITYKN